jgi:uncharacterized protein
MSELINNSDSRKGLLKHMILQLHEGVAPEAVKKQMVDLMSKIPYGEVVEVEQELITEGLPEEEVLRLCDIHTEVLDGKIDLSGMLIVPPGHPADTFKQENRELEKVVAKLRGLFTDAEKLIQSEGAAGYSNQLKSLFHSLTDVDKHYRRKENLLFPFLEKHGITGPPKVMWGKHDETRDLLKNAMNALDFPADTAEAMKMKIELHLAPAAKAVTDMILKEEEILLPMTLDKLNESEWYDIYKQTQEIGYCLFDPRIEWKPAGLTGEQGEIPGSEPMTLPSGRFTPEELLAILNTLPVDVTFVDRHDKVKYFSQGRERIFDRNRAILGRDVRMCHPPSSVHVVEQILSDFKNGTADSAPFWIQMQGKFIHIEYFALRNEDGEYLGTVEVSQDLTEKRALSGDQRLLSYRRTDPKSQKMNSQMNNPAWLDRAKIKYSLDARPLLAQGIHPLERVIREAATLDPGEIYEILTPFPPAPMIEKMAAAGYATHSETGTDGIFHTYFRKG